MGINREEEGGISRGAEELNSRGAEVIISRGAEGFNYEGPCLLLLIALIADSLPNCGPRLFHHKSSVCRHVVALRLYIYA